MISVQIEPRFDSWREKARQLVSAGLHPADVQWTDDPRQASLFTDIPELQSSKKFQVPKAFVELAQVVSCARFEGRWDLLYRMLFRIAQGDSDLLKRVSDADVLLANDLAKSVRKDIHKMHAFVRFKAIDEGTPQEHYVAWHQPEHFTVRIGTPFFERRFGDKPWSILTPDESAHWDGKNLEFGPGVPAHEFEHTDSLDEIWKSYYKSIFNPARIKLKAMRAEMATKYWSHLPETEIIRDLVRQAPSLLQTMAEDQYKAAAVPPGTLEELAAAARACRACPLHEMATQTVFGTGPKVADLMIVGEQPGDEEDLRGLPFSGPAGSVLNEILEAAGIPRDSVYLTNAVKHFKFEWRGILRLHKKPTGRESEACRPWLEAEIARVRPKLILALGATAGTALFGRLPNVGRERGQIQYSEKWHSAIMLTWHPAAILRSNSPEEHQRRSEEMAADLAKARSFIDSPAG